VSRPDEERIREQIEYYRARAAEYDEWFLREGRYDRGDAHRARWFAEIATIERALGEERKGARILELACGTGLWTRHLAAADRPVVAIDSSPEVIAINRRRVGARHVRYVVADVFALPLAGRFDLVFFAFWLSHVPETRFDEFWRALARLVAPGGRVFFVDSLFEPESTARDHGPLTASGVVRRKLNDGRFFDIVKVFHEPADLERRVCDLGWAGRVRSSGRFFLYGSLTP
jgi:SAM-dependent methyltransferase